MLVPRVAFAALFSFCDARKTPSLSNALFRQHWPLAAKILAHQDRDMRRVRRATRTGVRALLPVLTEMVHLAQNGLSQNGLGGLSQIGLSQNGLSQNCMSQNGFSQNCLTQTA